MTFPDRLGVALEVKVHDPIAFEVLAHGLGFPEGPAFLDDGSVVAVDIDDGRVVRVMDGESRIKQIDLSTGKTVPLYEDYEGQPLRGPNDVVFDSVGDFGSPTTARDGSRAWTGERSTTRPQAEDRSQKVAFPLWGPNGIGLSPDGSSVVQT